MARYVISQFTMPDGNIMELKDKVAREAAKGGTHFLGITETVIEDESQVSTLIITDEEGHPQEVSAENGDMVFYGPKEYIYTEIDHKWHEFGDLTNLGTLAMKNNAAGMYTPGGTVSAPTFTGNDINYTPAGSISKPNITVENSKKSASMPTMDFNYDSQHQHLTIGWASGGFQSIDPQSGNPVTSQQATVVTDVSAELEATPTFTGTQEVLSVSGTNSQPVFTGTSATITVE